MIRKIHAVSAHLNSTTFSLCAYAGGARPLAPAGRAGATVQIGRRRRPAGRAGPGTARGRPGPSPAVKEEAEQNHAAGE